MSATKKKKGRPRKPPRDRIRIDSETLADAGTVAAWMGVTVSDYLSAVVARRVAADMRRVLAATQKSKV